MTENYLKVLEESLEKKLQIMAKLREYSLEQQKVFKAADPEPEQFDEYVDRKSGLIQELTALDNGFEALYRDVSAQLREGREKYAEQIRRLQELVAKVTEESIALQAQEARNKNLVEEYFRRERSRIAKGRKNSRAAYDYYKSMSQTNVALPQYMDSKK